LIHIFFLIQLRAFLFVLGGRKKMNQRDRELLDRQFRGYNTRGKDGIVTLTVVAVFFAGMTIGGALFPRQSDQTRTSSEATMISLVNSTPSQAAMGWSPSN